MPAFDNFFRSTLNGDGQLRIQKAQILIDFRRRTLDQGNGADKGMRHAKTADRKILDGALGLGSVESIYRNVEFPHAETFDSKGWAHG